MDKNYASWELTQLLPEVNPNDKGYESQKWYNDNRNGKIDMHLCQDANEINDYTVATVLAYLRDAWTWEDIRLHLENVDIYYHVYRGSEEDNYGNIFHTYYYIVEKFSTGETYHNSCLYEGFDTYEEAREAAIRYCLTEMEANANCEETSKDVAWNNAREEENKENYVVEKKVVTYLAKT